MVRHKAADRGQIRLETRQALLAAAANEFADQGYDRANVNRIAEAAGFAIGTFYNYFPSKRDLMLAFIDEVASLHVDAIVVQVRSASDPGRRLEVFFQAGFVFIQEHLIKARAIFNTLNGPDEIFRQHLFDAYQPLFLLLAEDVLGPGIAENMFRQVDLEKTAGLLMLIYLGTGSQFTPEGEHWLQPEQVAEFAQHALQV
jgi:AcrR family transcriptional regulator